MDNDRHFASRDARCLLTAEHFLQPHRQHRRARPGQMCHPDEPDAHRPRLRSARPQIDLAVARATEMAVNTVVAAVGVDGVPSPESAAQRNGPLPSQNNGRIYAGTNPGKSKALLKPCSFALALMLFP